jgi:hypothetical protein
VFRHRSGIPAGANRGPSIPEFSVLYQYAGLGRTGTAARRTAWLSRPHVVAASIGVPSVVIKDIALQLPRHRPVCVNIRAVLDLPWSA